MSTKQHYIFIVIFSSSVEVKVYGYQVLIVINRAAISAYV